MKLILFLQNLDYNGIPSKIIQDNKNKNKLPTKNSDGRIFGKEIGNQINNIKDKNSSFYIQNFQNKKSRNISKENNKNKEYKKKDNIKNNNKFKQKNDENNQNNFFANKNTKKENFNKNFILKKKEVHTIDKNNEKIIYHKNPIEEYDEDISKNMFIEENYNRPDYQKMLNLFSDEEFSKRLYCFHILINLSETFEFRQETIYLTMNIFDRYILSLKISNRLGEITKYTFKIILLACIFIASKYEEIYPPVLDDYYEIFELPKNEILRAEYEILQYIKFEFHICSPYLFLTKFFDDLEKNEPKKILHGAQFILELSITSLEFCILKPSLQAAICIYLSKRLLNNKIYKKKLWSMESEYITGYSEDEIKNNSKKVINTMKKYFSDEKIYKNCKKTAVFMKYDTLKYSEVSSEFKNLFI